MVVLKIAGRRTLLEAISFNFILLLIISEATQQALLGNDVSITGTGLIIITASKWIFHWAFLKAGFPGWSCRSTAPR